MTKNRQTYIIHKFVRTYSKMRITEERMEENRVRGRNRMGMAGDLIKGTYQELMRLAEESQLKKLDTKDLPIAEH